MTATRNLTPDQDPTVRKMENEPVYPRLNDLVRSKYAPEFVGHVAAISWSDGKAITVYPVDDRGVTIWDTPFYLAHDQWEPA